MKKALTLFWVLLLAAGIIFALFRNRPLEPVRVGILHSRTGTMALSEKPVIDATLFAIETLNQDGGVLGHPIEPVVADGGSNPLRFAREAQRLIDKEHVAVIFGCWTSASRKEVKPVVEAAQNLLVYPVQYEGVEKSPNIVYTGSVPNQQIKPAVKWALDHLGRRFFLVGSDYIFPRVANTLIRDLANFLGAEVVGERYLPLGATDFSEITDEIARTNPAVIFNTLNGDSNLAFFAALRDRRLTSARLPVFSFSIGETELQAMEAKLGRQTLTGNYAAWSYFETLPDAANQAFLKNFRSRFGPHRQVNDPMIAAAMGVRLWAQAVTEAGNFAPTEVLRTFGRQSVNGPGGIIYIDSDNHHAWKPVRIGRINAQGGFDIVWDSRKPIHPEPFPGYCSPDRWEALEQSLFQQWNNHWEKHPDAGGDQ